MSADPARRPAARKLVLLGLIGLAVAHLGAWRGIEPIRSWFYDCAWWSYVLAVDGAVHLRHGRSLLLSRPRAFLLSVWSCAFWLAFELLNLRLENWYYVGVPPDLASRSLGFLVSFASVLPAVLETADLVGTFRFAARARSKPFAITPRLRRGLALAGAVSILAALLFPRVAFPLAWGAAVFLIEPWLAPRDPRSLLAELAAGRPGRALRLLVAGAICGLLWEAWNTLGSAGWIYTVPFFEDSKLFEMPIAGFLGFPPFALECYAFARLLVASGLVSDWDASATASLADSRRRQVRWALAALAASAPTIWLVNRFTLHATAPRIVQMRSLTNEQRARLSAAGFRQPADLLDGAAPAGLEQLLPNDALQRALDEAHLMQVAKMGARGVAWLESIGIHDAAALAALSATELRNRIRAVGRGPSPSTSPAELRIWLRRAGNR